MRDQVQTTIERPAAFPARKGLQPADIIGMYANETGPLQDSFAGVPYHVVRIEDATRDITGKLTYIMARRVWVNDNGSIVRESDRVKLLGFMPRAFMANPASAKARADKANEQYRYISAGGAGVENYSAWRAEQDARLDRILIEGAI